MKQKELEYNILKIIACGKPFDSWVCGDFLEQEQTDEGEWMGKSYFCPECHKKAEEILRIIPKIFIKEYFDSSLSDEIFTPNNKSKTFIELYNLEIILKRAVRKLKEELGAKDERDAQGMINEGIINKIFGDKLTK
ncbi:MAG TPA: hypothetical protein VMZ91_16780 [Candidatus Paceibacterota bacterium]|nr:hypothetical protein [Candidatus Paceibacterota bacterium]